MKLLVLLIFFCYFLLPSRHIGDFYLIIFLDAQIGCTFPLSHEFEQFGSVHKPIVHRKYIGRSGTRTGYPRALSQPRYQ